MEKKSNYNKKLGIALLSATVLGGLALGTQSRVYADDATPNSSTTLSTETSKDEITTPLTEADYEAIALTAWGAKYFTDVSTALPTPNIYSEPVTEPDVDNINKWALPKLVDAYNTYREDTYNEADVLAIWKKKYNYKEVDTSFADFDSSKIDYGKTYYFKEDKLFVVRNPGMGGFGVIFSPKEQWVVEKDSVKLSLAYGGDVGPYPTPKVYPITVTVKLNNKEYTGGISKSKFYLSNVVDSEKVETSTTTKPVDKKDTPTKAEKAESSTELLLNELSGYTYEQVLAAQVWYTLTDGNYQYKLYRREAGEMIYGYGDSKRFPDVTYTLFENNSGRGYAYIYMVDYKDNGDGTVTVYNMPKHWHIDDSEIASFTQNILDTAKVVKLKEASKADILKILKMGDFSELTTGNSSNSDASTSTDADAASNTKQEKPTADKIVDKKDKPDKTDKEEVSTKLLLKELSGYTYEQVLAAQVWCSLTDGAYSYSLTRHEAGEAISKYGPSKQFPSVTYYLRENSDRSYAAAYVVTYKDNGDGSVTVYNVPKHWQMPAEEILSVTQNILDTAKVVKLKEVSKEDILKVLKMGDFSELTTGNSSNSDASTSTDADDTGNTKQEKPIADSKADETEVIFPIVILDDKTTKSTSPEADKNLASDKGESHVKPAKSESLSRVESRHLPKSGDSRSFLVTLLGLITLAFGVIIARKYKR